MTREQDFTVFHQPPEHICSKNRIQFRIRQFTRQATSQTSPGPVGQALNMRSRSSSSLGYLAPGHSRWASRRRHEFIEIVRIINKRENHIGVGAQFLRTGHQTIIIAADGKTSRLVSVCRSHDTLEQMRELTRTNECANNRRSDRRFFE
jgi:hypothetical protein